MVAAMGVVAEAGYKYEYSFSMDESIIDLYNIVWFNPYKTFLYEIRTSFILKKRPGEDEEVDSERFNQSIGECFKASHLSGLIRYRLQDYWMSRDQMTMFSAEAYDFAKKIADDPQHSLRGVIPIVADLKVFTVQQEEEPLTETMERLICAARLVPVDMWGRTTAGLKRDRTLRKFLNGTTRVRVENADDEKALAVMPVCNICSRKPSIGSVISDLKCGHAFHSHCLLRLLDKKRPQMPRCPTCNRDARPATPSKYRSSTVEEKMRRFGLPVFTLTPALVEEIEQSLTPPGERNKNEENLTPAEMIRKMIEDGDPLPCTCEVWDCKCDRLRLAILASGGDGDQQQLGKRGAPTIGDGDSLLGASSGDGDQKRLGKRRAPPIGPPNGDKQQLGKCGAPPIGDGEYLLGASSGDGDQQQLGKCRAPPIGPLNGDKQQLGKRGAPPIGNGDYLLGASSGDGD